MRIGLLGGVFENPMGRFAHSAPENVLLRFLREAGHEVVPMSIDAPASLGVPLDVYHANHFGIGAYGLMLAHARPLVFTSHNPFLVSDYPVDESRVDRVFQPHLLRSADVVVALSRREEELLRKRFSLGDDVRFSVIPNGLDLELYDVEAQGDEHPLDVLTVGQLVPYKGHDLLVQAVARLAPRFPRLRLVLIGYRHDTRPALERLAGELGVLDRLVFEGPYDTRTLAARYRSCAVYAQPSLAECFPVTVLEAMACECAIVATDVGGVAEQLADTGIVVPPSDVEALEAALARLLDDEELRRNLGRAARERCRMLYDGRSVAARHLALYEELADGRVPQRTPLSRRLASRTALGAMRRRHRLARLLS